ncbi:phosphoribosylglycinamide formyltransferase [Jannaschia sp. KMU-145]|uniref:phosphoribosylglycinamide formyltransferase n=1 Tax=Jannaschia halovivens TaxID=3388667 RepID=UPI00396AFF48
MKVGFLLSAGGAAFARAAELSGWPAPRFFVLTDRACGAEDKADALGIGRARIDGASRAALSEAAAERFRDEGCDVVVLHYARLVGPELFDRMPVVNVHPALLPAFPGLDGVGDAARAGTRIQGATLHVVDAGMDTGPILAQTAAAVPRRADAAWREALAYRQKVVVTLALLDWCDAGLVDPTRLGRAAFDLDRAPEGDTLCTPGFCDEAHARAASRLLADLPRLPA